MVRGDTPVREGEALIDRWDDGGVGDGARVAIDGEPKRRARLWDVQEAQRLAAAWRRFAPMRPVAMRTARKAVATRKAAIRVRST